MTKYIKHYKITATTGNRPRGFFEKEGKTMRKNLVVVATSLALSVSMVLTSPAYAGVIKKNATGAAAKALEQSKVDEKKENEAQVSSETSSQGQGDQTEQAHAGLKDQSPTDQAAQPQKEVGRDNPMTVFPRADYLGPDGVAKDPSYVTNNFEFEVNKTIYQCVRSTTDARWLKMRNEPFVYPEINPDTGYPLWSTKPFWRPDGSFDVYGYLKQFPARKSGQITRLYIDSDHSKSPRDNIVTGTLLTIRDYYAENPPYNTRDEDEFFLWVPFTADDTMTSTDGRYLMDRRVIFSARDFYADKGTNFWKGFIDINQINNAPTVKITGADNSYMYLIQVDMLEKTMRNYLNNPHVRDKEIKEFDGTYNYTGLMYISDYQ